MSLKTYIVFAVRNIKTFDVWDAKWLNETAKQNPRKGWNKNKRNFGFKKKKKI